MRNASLLAFVFLVLSLFSTPVRAAAPNVEERLGAIVAVHARIPAGARTARSLGTEREGNGIVIDRRGHILTIGYLILEAESITVILSDGRKLDAVFAGYDHDTGFGLLRTADTLDIEPMALGESAGVSEGDQVLVASHGGSEAVLGSLVTSRRPFAGGWEYLLERAIFTMPAHPTFGGAALIGADGRLLGVGSLYSPSALPGVGIVPGNMFVPIDLLKPILTSLKKTGRSGRPPRPWMGLYGEEVHGRIFVSRVSRGGPAEQAGIRRGDIIVAVKAGAVESLADFYRKVWALGAAGVDVPLRVFQGNQVREITIHTTDRMRYLSSK